MKIVKEAKLNACEICDIEVISVVVWINEFC